MPTSSTSSSRRAFTSLALILGAFAGTACGAFSPEKNPDEPASASPASPTSPHGDAGPKAPAVTGTPDPSEITEAFGIFVAPSGRADNDGSRGRPLGTIKDGIDLGKRLGKRVYVCTGTFREALVLADSISIIGGLDCGVERWKTGALRTRIEAPSSPAVRAKDITSPTRLEGIDIVAPDATEPSGSSIGLLAEHSAGLVIAGSKITAGNATNGIDGVEGIQLVETSSALAEQTVLEAKCVAFSTCLWKTPLGGGFPYFAEPEGGSGGRSLCVGVPGHSGLPGGDGGSGKLFMTGFLPTNFGGLFYWRYNVGGAPYAPNPGESRLGTSGAEGASGTPSSTLGILSGEGYTAANGVAGTDGAPGNGGSGGFGTQPNTAPVTVSEKEVWRGNGGPGGGAGGCPGLAGTPGTGGGASIALALLDSPITVDGSEITTGRGGNGGRGALGSDPTPGGLAGTNLIADASAAAKPGGNGGFAGISTNGSNGPSIGILHSGPAPTVRGVAKITPGRGGAAIDARSKSALGTTRTIPETPAGISQDILAL